MLRALWAAGTPLASLAARRSSATAAPLVQHVRIKTRKRWRNAAIGAGVMYICWSAYFTRVVVPPIADHIDEGGKPLFIPFPFTFKVVPSRPFKATDPEWKEYIRIANDPQALAKIKNDILETVRAAAESNAILTRRCGSQMRIRRHWLDLDFPHRPPPKIMRNGLLLTSEGLDLVSMEVDSTTMLRVTRALWPAPVALSASSFIRTLVHQNVQTAARYFGFEMADPDPPPLRSLASTLKRRLEEAEAAAAQNQSRTRSAKDNGGGGGDGNVAATGTTGAAAVTGAASAAAAATAAPSPSPANDASTDDSSRILNAKDLVPFDSLRSSIDVSWTAFRKKLAETWRPLRPQPPSGSVGVTGFVELVSPNSRITIEVVAFWDPKTRKYDAPTLQMKLRKLRVRAELPQQGR
ncbi:hypothetical protein SPI_04428 [Niveomyces insectorum RCEF 264]|uniref:Uncharacterized protein n=1 Tax=Niveomyces insectorum RCEF 264 TaxID=1081102 RepID=A0A167VQP9_9HYPO|nr:hypothetical protein SPI_04428 [Niveomyces insectorum RCEF 264]